MATNKRRLGRVGFYCGLIVFLIITLFPFFVMLMTSFKSAKEAISLHPTLLPQEWTLEHYIDIFNPLIFRLLITFVTACWSPLCHQWWRYSWARSVPTRCPDCVLKGG